MSSAATPTTRSSSSAAHGATLADAVKQVVYVTDIRYQADVAKCRREAYGAGPILANTFLVISALAIPGMLLEIDVTAVVAKAQPRSLRPEKVNVPVLTRLGACRNPAGN